VKGRYILTTGFMYLAGHIFLLTVFSQTYKLAHKQKCNLRMMNLWYRFLQFMISTVIVVFAFCQGIRFNTASFGLGFTSGLLMSIGVISMLYAVQSNRLSTSWAIIRLSLVIPVSTAILFWGETPTWKEILGLVLAVGAMILVTLEEKEYTHRSQSRE